MQAKIIRFPKHPTQYHALYYFREYHEVFFHIFIAWTFMVFVMIYEHTPFVLGIGIAVWLAGMILMIHYIIKLGLKRKEQGEQRRRFHVI
ncbi:hypothetical protein ACNQFZ_09620 [Schinkia sp. CFF1]